MKKILISSNNRHKIEEMKALLEPLGYALYSLKDAGIDFEVEESGTTFEENAVLKATTLHRDEFVFTIADDSGLMVDALGGAPGVYSARYAGEPSDDRRNNETLLEALREVPEERRTARFVSVIALFDGKESRVFRGEVEGRILFAPQGEHGFGYDPLFYYAPLQRTFASLSSEEKNQISHRAEAMKRVLHYLKATTP